jgi:hypothetical protein
LLILGRIQENSLHHKGHSANFIGCYLHPSFRAHFVSAFFSLLPQLVPGAIDFKQMQCKSIIIQLQGISLTLNNITRMSLCSDDTQTTYLYVIIMLLNASMLECNNNETDSSPILKLVFGTLNRIKEQIWQVWRIRLQNVVDFDVFDSYSLQIIVHQPPIICGYSGKL